MCVVAGGAAGLGAGDEEAGERWGWGGDNGTSGPGDGVVVTVARAWRGRCAQDSILTSVGEPPGEVI